MKNYSKITDKNIKSIESSIISELKELLVDKTFTYKCLSTSTNGVVTDVVSLTTYKINSESDSISPVVKTLINGVEKTFVLAMSMQNRTIIFAEDITESVSKYSNILLKLSQFTKNKALEERLKTEEGHKEAERKHLEYIEKEKRQLHEKNILQSLMKTKANADCSNTDYGSAIKWLAENVTSIYACIPDFTDSWFSRQFGNDAVRTVIDTSRKTASGYPMKWSPSFSVSIKTTKDMPYYFREYFDDKKRANNTQFVFDLVENYDFSFGKTQNVAKILSNIHMTVSNAS